MNPELPDLDRPSDTDKLHLHNRSMAKMIVVGGAVLFPLVWLLMSFVTGKNIWLAAINIVGMYAGVYVMFLGWRRDNRQLVYRGGGIAAAVFLLTVSTGSYLSP
ncbi:MULTISPECIES: hypothetical protein [unclassified Streptomyces]|uniref:hypothetical protein n=1 Tax=unclassified Streptomyces TaxID=2593676 RepID=UPI003BB7ED61